jgi:hypothetical protein
VTELRYIEPNNKWNNKTGRLEYLIEINRPIGDAFIPQQYFCFAYDTAEVRDAKMQLLKINLEGIDYINFIGG